MLPRHLRSPTRTLQATPARDVGSSSAPFRALPGGPRLTCTPTPPGPPAPALAQRSPRPHPSPHRPERAGWAGEGASAAEGGRTGLLVLLVEFFNHPGRLPGTQTHHHRPRRRNRQAEDAAGRPAPRPRAGWAAEPSLRAKARLHEPRRQPGPRGHGHAPSRARGAWPARPRPQGKARHCSWQVVLLG